MLIIHLLLFYLNSYVFFIVYIYSFILVQAFGAMNLIDVDGDEFDHQQQKVFQDLQRENRELRQTVQDLQKTLRQREVILLLLFLMSICFSVTFLIYLFSDFHDRNKLSTENRSYKKSPLEVYVPCDD